MAKRRMFSLEIVDTDAFLEMPSSTQSLYFHFGMRADDEGFVGNPRRLIRMLGVSEDDYKLLVAKSFVIPFESGVCVIKHWKMNNYLQNDRLKPTTYLDEKRLLKTKENKAYTIGDNEDVYELDTKCIHSIDKSSIVEYSIDKSSKENTPIKTRYLDYVLLKDEEYIKLVELMGESKLTKLIENLNNYIGSKGKKYKSHYHTLRNWYNKDNKHQPKKDEPEWIDKKIKEFDQPKKQTHPPIYIKHIKLYAQETNQSWESIAEDTSKYEDIYNYLNSKGLYRR